MKQWFQLVLDYRDDPVAIIIDGAYFGRFRPDGGHTEDDQWVTLKGPFNEVIARVRAVLKRTERTVESSSSDMIEAGAVRIDVSRKLVYVEGE